MVQWYGEMPWAGTNSSLTMTIERKNNFECCGVTIAMADNSGITEVVAFLQSTFGNS